MEKSISLYELVDGIAKIEEFVDDEKSLAEYLDSIQIQFEDKVSNIIRYSRTLNLTSEAIKNEIDRLVALKKIYERKGQNLENYVSYAMQRIGKDSLELEIAKLSFRKSETTDIFDESAIPESFKKEKITVSIDKTAIKEVIKKGEEVPGAKITSHKNLQIK